MNNNNNEKLKKEVWSINTKGNDGLMGKPDIAFGITEDGKSALRLDDKIFTGEGGSGGGLPEVTAADNGKVLGVEDGAWTALTTIPTITLDRSQFISFEETTIVVQLTAEQVDIFESNAPMINFDIIEGVVTLFATGNPSNRSSVLTPYGQASVYMAAHVDDDDKCYMDSLSIGA